MDFLGVNITQKLSYTCNNIQISAIKCKYFVYKKINNQKLAINGWLNKQQIIEHLKNLRFKIQGFQFEGLGETIRMKRMIRNFLLSQCLVIFFFPRMEKTFFFSFPRMFLGQNGLGFYLACICPVFICKFFFLVTNT